MTPIKITKLLLLTVLAFFLINSIGIAQISDQEDHAHAVNRVVTR